MLPERPRLLTVREFAAALRVSVPTAYRWIAAGEVTVIRYGKPRSGGDTRRGGAIRIPESEVDARLMCEPTEAA